MRARDRTASCSAPSSALAHLLSACSRLPSVWWEDSHPWELDSIPKWVDWLERPDSTESYGAVRLLCSETRPSLPEAKPACFSVLALQIPSSFHGLQHGHFIGILQVRTHRNPDANSRDAHSQRLQELGKVDRRGFAFGRGIRRDDDLFDSANRLLGTRRPHAIQARIGIRDVVADGARTDFFFSVANGVRQR